MSWVDPLSRALHSQAGQHGAVMLMYHGVAPGKGTPAWPWAVSMRRFCDQLDFLTAEGYATPTMGQLVAAPKRPGRTAVITFDDGYVDNLAACEELKKRGMRATFFIVSGSVGHEPRWPADGRPMGRLLSADELRDMQACGMEIGSHTMSHARLPDLDDVALVQELTDSRGVLEGLLGQRVGSFAYPYGAWDARCAAAVQRAGYTAACTTRSGWALRDNDPFKLRRLTVFNTDTAATLARKLALATNDGSWAAMFAYVRNRFAR